ncbi:MAG: hypothetical protein ABI718_12695 [Acidobacteriota bacterium]
MSNALSFNYQIPLSPEPPALPLPETAAVPSRLKSIRDNLGAAAFHLSSAAELSRSLEKTRRTEPVLTTLTGIDQLLGGGLSRGKLTEIAGNRSGGRFSAIIATVAAVTSSGEAAALVDLGDHFDPQLAEAAGVELPRLLWVRPQRLKDAVACAEMLIHTGFQLVVLDLGMHPVRGARVPEAAWVRLARAAEGSGTALIVSSPYPISRTASDAVLSAKRAHIFWQGSGQTPRILTGTSSLLTLEKHRHRRPGGIAGMRLLTSDAIGNAPASSRSAVPAVQESGSSPLPAPVSSV